MRSIVAAAMCCFVLASCSLYNVTNGKGNGIPILVKEPVRYQMTKVAMTHWKVTFALKAGDKEFPAPSGGMEVVASDDAFNALYLIGGQLSGDAGITPDNFAARVAARLHEAEVHWGGCDKGTPSGIVCIRPSVRYGRTIQNDVVVVSELSGSQYYINTRRPWIGSANATIDLATDGTMTKAQAEVEDKTVETILSVLPIGSFFAKQWNLDGADAALAEIARTDRRTYALISGPGRPKPTIELTLEPVTWTYVLRRRLDKEVSAATALTYPDTGCAAATTPCVQLVSAASDAEKKAPEDKKPEGWTISGSLIPPGKE